MANYHLEIGIISRGKGRSIASAISYASRSTIHDHYLDKTYCNPKNDLIFRNIYLPVNAPPEFSDLQNLCDEIDKTESRYDARTARTFIGSLPNELPADELIQIVQEFVEENFVSQDLCAIVAIHEGRNKKHPLKNNPHAHIIVPTRTLDEKGFYKKKDRKYNSKKYVHIWREEWARVQNRAYERNGLDIRVSHESLEVQGEHDREPLNHISRRDWQKEQNGIRTLAGDERRSIKTRNQKRALQHQLEKERAMELDVELSR